MVTLYVRVWIETGGDYTYLKVGNVTLYVRVWIETNDLRYICLSEYVTLYVRVWIETSLYTVVAAPWRSHPLREGVD